MTFHRDQAEIRGLHVLSHDKEPVPVGYLVPNTICEDFKRVFDSLFRVTRKGLILGVVCYLWH